MTRRESLANGQPYSDAVFALLTQHGKEAVVGPVLERELGARLRLVTGFDTDTLGTFTREIPREGTQLEAARRKANIAIELSGARLGLGSEGSFGPGPFGLSTWNTELVVLIDAERRIEVVGRARAAGHHHHAEVRSLAELEGFSNRVRFTSHALTVRPHQSEDPRVIKGLRDPKSLVEAFQRSQRLSPSAVVWVESDLRAHMNPTRMETIQAAARDLAQRLARQCPECGLPGFGVEGVIPGLPCAVCHTPTHVAVAERLGCVACAYEQQRPLVTKVERADPQWCDVCNP